MPQASHILNEKSRAIVLASLQRHCEYRGWSLLAAHVRSNHVHVIIEAEARPEKILNELKSYASRELNRLTDEPPNRRRWARNGSTRWLWKDHDVQKAIQYIIEEQGEAMATFLAADYSP